MSGIGWLKFLCLASFRSLLRSPRRTLISLLSIGAAAAAMMVFQSFVDGIKHSFQFQVIHSIYAHYAISERGFENDEKDDPFAYQIEGGEAMKADIEKAVGPLEFFGKRQRFYGLISYNDRSFGGVGWGIDAKAEKEFLTLVQVKEGKHLADSDEQSLFIAVGLAKKLRIKVGDLSTVLVTTSQGSINAVDLVVSGIYQTGVTDLDQGTFLINHSVAESLLDIKGAHEFLVAFKEGKPDIEYQAGLGKLLKEKYPKLEASHWRKRAPFYDNTMAWVEKQIFVFRIIVLLIATLSIVNVFTMGLMERTGEFGTLRAIGTSRKEVVAMIFGESMAQALVGSLMGIILGGTVIFIINARGGITMPPPPLLSVPFKINFWIPWGHLFRIGALCALVSGGAGIFPAYRIARMNIVKALGRNS